MSLIPVSRGSSPTQRGRFISAWRLGLFLVCAVGWTGWTADAPAESARSRSIKQLGEKLGVTAGMTVADIGCGQGTDTFSLAALVGTNGTVYAEEIAARELQELLKQSRERGQRHIVPVLGHTEDPRLPDATIDLAYLRFVFHHFARPNDMLHELWRDLKPGGHLVIVDREKGPLRQWVETDSREQHHHWTGETTVVRLAREAGFLFAGAFEELWFEKEPFVLAFRKPFPPAVIGADPDLPLLLTGHTLARELPALTEDAPRVAFIGLDRGRAVLPALRQTWPASTHLYEMVLEEWATSTNEVPAEYRSDDVTVTRTIHGAWTSPESGLWHAAVFADAYHRLWDPDPFLTSLRAALAPDAWIVILDRAGPPGESRRLANHHRRIHPDQVIAELARAKFELARELTPPAADRFALLFRPSK